MTRDEWAALGTQLLAAWGHSAPPPGWMDACYGLVAGYPTEVVLKAAHQHAVEDRPGYLPSMGRVAGLAAKLLGEGPPDFDQVYAEVQRAVRLGGTWADPDALGLSAPALGLVLAYGWKDWCAAENMDNLRAQARRMYDAQAGRAVTRHHREQLRSGAPRHVVDLLPPALGDACPMCGQLDTAGRLCTVCAVAGVG